jgi:hypothetical protein
MLRSGAQPGAGVAHVLRRNVRLSPLGFAPVGLGCRSAACAGVLRLRNARAAWCGGRYIRRGAPVGSASFRIAVAPAIAPVRLRAVARRVARCTGRIRVDASVAAAGRTQSAELEIRAG